ncbi:TPA: hypothetical protein ACGSTL_001306 [Vibrio parahaemolyticus]|uniref:hypothetical protein n=1 Tax=Vibrio campbellii TaxID=680 RepID=UPI001F082532|nr:hypothetical protein [Vibrio campbellii]UMM06751.1 hypothetical protein MKR81_26185 [Vibrio campbellii]
MISTELRQKAVEPLVNIATTLIQQRSTSGWKAAQIHSEYKFGMMLTTLSITNRSGKSELVAIPIEYCAKINQFRVEYSEKTKKQISKIELEVTSKGVYDLKLIA